MISAPSRPFGGWQTCRSPTCQQVSNEQVGRTYLSRGQCSLDCMLQVGALSSLRPHVIPCVQRASPLTRLESCGRDASWYAKRGPAQGPAPSLFPWSSIVSMEAAVAETRTGQSVASQESSAICLASEQLTQSASRRTYTKAHRVPTFFALSSFPLPHLDTKHLGFQVTRHESSWYRRQQHFPVGQTG